MRKLFLSILALLLIVFVTSSISLAADVNFFVDCSATPIIPTLYKGDVLHITNNCSAELKVTVGGDDHYMTLNCQK